MNFEQSTCGFTENETKRIVDRKNVFRSQNCYFFIYIQFESTKRSMRVKSLLFLINIISHFEIMLLNQDNPLKLRKIEPKLNIIVKAIIDLKTLHF